MVAAGIAAKNERILPYLSAGRLKSATDLTDVYRTGLDYGYSFMEKFVEVPFRVPNRMTVKLADGFLLSQKRCPHTRAAKTPSAGSAKLSIGSGLTGWIRSGRSKNIERIQIQSETREAVCNVFRLRVMIALSIGALVPAPRLRPGSKGRTELQLSSSASSPP